MPRTPSPVVRMASLPRFECPRGHVVRAIHCVWHNTHTEIGALLCLGEQADTHSLTGERVQSAVIIAAVVEEAEEHLLE